MFIYCLNNPIVNKDENGYVCCSAMDGVAGSSVPTEKKIYQSSNIIKTDAELASAEILHPFSEGSLGAKVNGEVKTPYVESYSIEQKLIKYALNHFAINYKNSTQFIFASTTFGAGIVEYDDHGGWGMYYGLEGDIAIGGRELIQIGDLYIEWEATVSVGGGFHFQGGFINNEEYIGAGINGSYKMPGGAGVGVKIWYKK